MVWYNMTRYDSVCLWYYLLSCTERVAKRVCWSDAHLCLLRQGLRHGHLRRTTTGQKAWLEHHVTHNLKIHTHHIQQRIHNNTQETALDKSVSNNIMVSYRMYIIIGEKGVSYRMYIIIGEKGVSYRMYIIIGEKEVSYRMYVIIGEKEASYRMYIIIGEKEVSRCGDTIIKPMNHEQRLNSKQAART